MKNRILNSILLVILVITYSCKKDNPANSKANFSAKIQGTEWTGSIIMAVYFANQGRITLTAAGSNPYDQVSLDIKGSGTGTFPINDDNIGSAVIGSASFTSMFNTTPVGQIVITKFDATNKLISGTFYFDGENMEGTVYHVTEGKFENVDLTIN